MAYEPCAAHPVRMANGNCAAIDVVLVVFDAEPVAAIHCLHCKSLIQLPQAYVIDLEPMTVEQLGDREYRANAHLIGCASRDRDAAAGTEWPEIAPLGEFRLHDHHSRG